MSFIDWYFLYLLITASIQGLIPNDWERPMTLKSMEWCGGWSSKPCIYCWVEKGVTLQPGSIVFWAGAFYVTTPDTTDTGMGGIVFAKVPRDVHEYLMMTIPGLQEQAARAMRQPSLGHWLS